MFKIIVLVVFMIILDLDWINSLIGKEINWFEVAVRSFMIIAFCYINNWF